MGRKATPAAKPAVDFNNENAADTLKKSDERAQQLAVIDQQFGDLAEYNRERAINEARFYIERGGEAFMEAGKRLILLKEHEGHGNFIKALDAIGVGRQTAFNMMKVAAKFSNVKTFGHLERSKLLELAVLDDEEIAELEKGGSVAGLEIDDIDKMSVRELKAALREAQADNQANEELLADKTKKIDALDRKLKKLPETRPWSEECAALVGEIQTAAKKVAPLLGVMNERIVQLGEMMAETEPEETEGRATARDVISAVHALVNLLAPIQQRTYDEMGQYAPVEYTGLGKTK